MSYDFVSACLASYRGSSLHYDLSPMKDLRRVFDYHFDLTLFLMWIGVMTYKVFTWLTTKCPLNFDRLYFHY